MGMTAVEKVFARHAGLDRVRAGEIVAARMDRIMLHDITGALAVEQLAAMGAERVVEPSGWCWWATTTRRRPTPRPPGC